MARKYVAEEEPEDWEEDSEFDDYGSSDDDVSDTDDCPYCGREMYAGAYRCPHCERYISKEDAPAGDKPLWMRLAAILAIVGALGWLLVKLL